MSLVRPFAAVRPKPSLASRVCAPPYDVMSADEARAMAEDNPLSFLRVSRAELELPHDADPYGAEVYSRAAANWRRLIAEGALFRDDKPRFYLYRQVWGAHSQTGIVACASIAEYDRNLVRKHEFTRPDKEDDRVRHMEALGAQTGPAFLTYRATPGLDAAIARNSASEPVVDFTAEDGIRHSAWIVRDAAEIADVSAQFAALPCLYIADGHHRSAAASRVCAARRAANPKHTGGEPYNFFLSVIFPHSQLRILAYNRAIKDLRGMQATEFLAKLGDVAELPDGLHSQQPVRKGEVGVYLGGKWRLARWRPDAVPADAVGSLDVAVLQDRVLAPLLGVGDPRKDKRIQFVGGIRGTAELERLVDSGEWAVAFSMHPTSLEDLMAVADGGGIMPPKSTWFEPKLRDAMFSHEL